MIKQLNQETIRAALAWSSADINSLADLIPIGWTHLNQALNQMDQLMTYELQDAMTSVNLLPQFWFADPLDGQTWRILNPFLKLSFETVFNQGKIITYQFQLEDDEIHETPDLITVMNLLYNAWKRRTSGAQTNINNLD